MPHTSALRQCLIDCDVDEAVRLWAHIAPHLPQPADRGQALVMLHHARTQAVSIPLRARAYSHRWLIDNGYPSGLPDELKPKAERIYPRIVEGVGIAVKARSPEFRPIAALVQQAMSDAVAEAYADNKTEPAFVRGRMENARRETLRRLIG